MTAYDAVGLKSKVVIFGNFDKETVILRGCILNAESSTLSPPSELASKLHPNLDTSSTFSFVCLFKDANIELFYEK